MSLFKRTIIEKMSEKEIRTAPLELFSRAAMLNWYLANFADRRDAEEVHTKLVEAKKAFFDLRVELEELTTTYEGCENYQSDLLTKLDEACHKGKEAVEKAKTVQAKGDKITKEYQKLKAKIDELFGKNKELPVEKAELNKRNQILNAQLKEVNEQLIELNTSIMTEHEEGFNKAFREVTFLLGTDVITTGFDMMKDVYEGRLIQLEEIHDDLGVVDTKAAEVNDKEEILADIEGD